MIPSVENQRGFTYLGLLILVTIIGLVAVLSLQVGALIQRREAEQELLAIGKEFYDAMSRYSDATPAGASPFAQKIDDLLRDPRYPNAKRYLRKLYIDPITGTSEWGIVQGSTAAGKGIIGIHSLSTATPIKKDNFDAPFGYLKNKKTYQDWVFTTVVQPSDGGAVAPPPSNANPANAPKPPKAPVAPVVPGAVSVPGTNAGATVPPPIPPSDTPPPAVPGTRPTGPVPSNFMPTPTPVYSPTPR